MPKFLAVHPLPTPITVQEAGAIGKAAKVNMSVDAYWINSWAQLNEEGKIVKILCQWNGTNIDAVRNVIAKAQIPCEGVYPMMVVDSEDFR